MAGAFPEEFRDEVVAVARKRKASLLQIAKDFGISDATLHNWLKAADKWTALPQALFPTIGSSELRRNVSACSSRKTRSSVGRLPISARARSQNDLPTGH